MVAYDYSHDHNAFVKECSCCGEVTIGTDIEADSIELFKAAFAISNGRAQTADGFQSRCKTCNSHKRRELGVTKSSLQAMFEAQDGKCAICNKGISIKLNAPAEFHAHVDHDDDKGEIRELLCGGCNRGIGIFKHNSTTLRQAADYVDKHRGVIPIRRQG